MDARYRLAPMRDARAREERVKQGDLAGAVSDERARATAVSEATARVAERRAALDAAVQRRAQALGTPGQTPTACDMVAEARAPTVARSAGPGLPASRPAAPTSRSATPAVAAPERPAASRPASPAPTVGALVQLEQYVQRLRRDLEAACGELARAVAAHAGQRDAVDAARTRLRHARAERELIERHFATWRAARQKLAERRED